MLVKKYISVETQVEVRIDAEDILESLAHLKDYEQKVIPAIMQFKPFLEAIQDETIAEMTNSQRYAIYKYLSDAANRFTAQAQICES